MREDIKTTIIGLAWEQTHPSCTVTEETLLLAGPVDQSLQFDSLDCVEFTIELEDEFDLDISDEDTEKWRTVGDVVEYVTKRIQETESV